MAHLGYICPYSLTTFSLSLHPNILLNKLPTLKTIQPRCHRGFMLCFTSFPPKPDPISLLPIDVVYSYSATSASCSVAPGGRFASIDSAASLYRLAQPPSSTHPCKKFPSTSLLTSSRGLRGLIPHSRPRLELHSSYSLGLTHLQLSTVAALRF